RCTRRQPATAAATTSTPRWPPAPSPTAPAGTTWRWPSTATPSPPPSTAPRSHRSPTTTTEVGRSGDRSPATTPASSTTWRSPADRTGHRGPGGELPARPTDRRGLVGPGPVDEVGPDGFADRVAAVGDAGIGGRCGGVGEERVVDRG